MLRRLAATLCLTSALTVPLVAQGFDCSLALTPSTPAGGPFAFEITSSVDSLAFIFVGTEPGPTFSKIGTIQVGMPFLLILDVPLAADQSMVCASEVPCDNAFAGFTLFMQAAVVPAGNPKGACLTNPASMEITAGACSTTGTYPGDFYSFTQGGWGTGCSGNNPGCLRDAHFDAVFPNGLVIGDPDGPDGDDDHALLFTSSAAIEAFLPHGGKAVVLGADAVDPTSGANGGVLAGQLVAATLNLAFDDAGVFNGVKNAGGAIGDLVYVAGVSNNLLGMSVREVIDLANDVIAGGSGASLSELVTALDVLNNNFDNGNQDQGQLSLP